jgi:hypothetical protein
MYFYLSLRKEKWQNINVKRVVIFMTKKKVIQEVELHLEQSGLICLMIGNVLLAGQQK